MGEASFESHKLFFALTFVRSECVYLRHAANYWLGMATAAFPSKEL